MTKVQVDVWEYTNVQWQTRNKQVHSKTEEENNSKQVETMRQRVQENWKIWRWVQLVFTYKMTQFSTKNCNTKGNCCALLSLRIVNSQGHLERGI